MQKAETAWNAARARARGGGKSRRKRRKSDSVPAASSAAVKTKMLVISDRKSSPADGRKLVWTASLSLSETRPPATRRMSEENVMMPSPPSWMSARMTVCPKPLKAVAVSTTTRPVTQTAEVAVNRASTKPMRPPRALGGSQSRTPPMKMAGRKLRARTRAGWKNRCCRVL